MPFLKDKDTCICAAGSLVGWESNDLDRYRDACSPGATGCSTPTETRWSPRHDPLSGKDHAKQIKRQDCNVHLPIVNTEAHEWFLTHLGTDQDRMESLREAM